jgi:hypothetical protein
MQAKYSTCMGFWQAPTGGDQDAGGKPDLRGAQQDPSIRRGIDVSFLISGEPSGANW